LKAVASETFVSIPSLHLSINKPPSAEPARTTDADAVARFMKGKGRGKK
jgi:hypothetical protein